MRRVSWLLSLCAVLYATQALAAYDIPIPCAALPALTGGDTTSSAGSCATTEQFHIGGAPQTVSGSSAGILFTSLPAGYNTLVLSCENLLLSSSSNSILIQVGEGGSPTWETGGHYTILNFNATSANSTVASQHSTTSTDITSGIPTNTTGIGTSIKMTLDSYTSTSLNKYALWSSANNEATNYYYFAGTAYWNSDTNAITGVQVVPSAGTISGTCSAYAIK